MYAHIWIKGYMTNEPWAACGSDAVVIIDPYKRNNKAYVEREVREHIKKNPRYTDAIGYSIEPWHSTEIVGEFIPFSAV